jgi:predicted O-methyltransferase YrrM
MDTTQPGRIPATLFYEQYDSTVRSLLERLITARRQARGGAGAARAMAVVELVEAGRGLCEVALSVLGAPLATPASAGPRGFLESAARVGHVMLTTSEYATRAGEALGRHLDYFHLHVPSGRVDRSATDDRHSVYLIECIVNCAVGLAGTVFNYPWLCADPRHATEFFDAAAADRDVTAAARAILDDATRLEGWCSPQKALMLYSLVREYRPSTVVEIGVYGGRSLAPIAAALNDNREGEVWGIETWSGAEATRHRHNLGNDLWWSVVDLARIKRDFLSFVLEHDLHERVHVVEAPSGRAGVLFDRIDLLHIDGNHSSFASAQDVVTYLPRIPAGGIIVFDDINWPSTSAALEILRDTCRLLHVVPVTESVTVPGCAAFMKV